jgi:EAL domain-containing protein (putative c-di-GMP-specific phosphodiesterase class I)/DNA-binding NarL/FixJ family response regulator
MSANAARQLIESVLIVDDSAVQRRVGAALCRELGITCVHEASNGQEALALLDALEAQPSLLVIDLEMPTMDGLELLRHLGRRNLRAPVIVASSRERTLVQSVQDLGAALGLRIWGTLQKPLTFETLGAVLRDGMQAAAEPQNTKLATPVDPDEVREAIDRSEITVHYHPQVAIETGSVHGVEALARWQHPTLGFVPPDQFIPIAEQHGLIHKLTLRVMNQALLQTALWKAQGLDLTVAINVSPLLLEREELVQEICDLQQCYSIPADRVVLEVTESSLLRQVAVALGVLSRLRLRGFGLSLDDYGTGFSSMQQLARIPFTELKIDRTFVHGAYARESLQAILRSALEMARRLGIATVAEGVETWEDWRLLKEYGCTLAQGWLVAKAMPSEQFEAWVKLHAARWPTLFSS